jgi:hypothetical protein
LPGIGGPPPSPSPICRGSGIIRDSSPSPAVPIGGSRRAQWNFHGSPVPNFTPAGPRLDSLLEPGPNLTIRPEAESPGVRGRGFRGLPPTDGRGPTERPGPERSSLGAVRTARARPDVHRSKSSNAAENRRAHRKDAGCTRQARTITAILTEFGSMPKTYISKRSCTGFPTMCPRRGRRLLYRTEHADVVAIVKSPHHQDACRIVSSLAIMAMADSVSG